jgi:hypothetical protein
VIARANALVVDFQTEIVPAYGIVTALGGSQSRQDLLDRIATYHL